MYRVFKYFIMFISNFYSGCNKIYKILYWYKINFLEILYLLVYVSVFYNLVKLFFFLKCSVFDYLILCNVNCNLY